MNRFLIAATLVGCATMASAQIQSQRPLRPKPSPSPTTQVFTPNTVIDAGALPPKPADAVPRGVMHASWDRKGWISTIDGKRSGIQFSLGSEHVIRGAGLANAVQGFIVSSRVPRGSTGRYESVGSVLTIVRNTDTEVVVRVSQISGGKVRWSSTGHRQVPDVRLILRTDGGGRSFNFQIRGARYTCAAGEPNCE